MTTGAQHTYWGNIAKGIKSVLQGLFLSFRHLKDAYLYKRKTEMAPEHANYFEKDRGIFTLQYPRETYPVPDNGRYRLHNEIEDCIVCDKCAKICPVNCIDIEAVKSPGEIRKASDGSSVRLYAARFDIDMAKCCYCGLCTTVCPTECLTMTKTYDYSEYDIRNMVYDFSDMTPEEIEQKKEEYEVHKAQKQRKSASSSTESGTSKPAGAKPVMKTAAPKVKPVIKKASGSEAKKAPNPVMKPKIKKSGTSEEGESDTTNEKPKKPAMKPRIKPRNKDNDNE